MHGMPPGMDMGMIMGMMGGMGGNPIDMWVGVLHQLVEQEINRRVDERVRDVCPAAAGKHHFGGPDGVHHGGPHGGPSGPMPPMMPPMHELWDKFSIKPEDNQMMGPHGWLDRQRLEDLVRSMDPNPDMKELEDAWNRARGDDDRIDYFEFEQLYNQTVDEAMRKFDEEMRRMGNNMENHGQPKSCAGPIPPTEEMWN